MLSCITIKQVELLKVNWFSVFWLFSWKWVSTKWSFFTSFSIPRVAIGTKSGRVTTRVFGFSSHRVTTSQTKGMKQRGEKISPRGGAILFFSLSPYFYIFTYLFFRPEKKVEGLNVLLTVCVRRWTCAAHSISSINLLFKEKKKTTKQATLPPSMDGNGFDDLPWPFWCRDLIFQQKKRKPAILSALSVLPVKEKEKRKQSVVISNNNIQLY